MNTKKVFTLLTIAILSSASCERKDLCIEETPVQGIPFEVTAEMTSTKTANDGIYTRWSENDSVHVWHRISGSSSYVDDGVFVVSDINAGTFKGELASALDNTRSYDWKMTYPYRKSGENEPGAAWQIQEGNNSTRHLCGAACPLAGELTANPAGTAPRIQMSNSASVIKVTVTNKNDYDLVVNTVKANSYTLQVKNPEGIAKGSSASFYIPVKPFSGDLKLSVDEYSHSGSKTIDAKAGYITNVDFDYDNQDKSLTNVTVWQNDRYNSFTDIIFFNRKYYCAFRQASWHVVTTEADRGEIIIRSSDDCKTWKDELVISNPGFDLRDPHFILPDDGNEIFLYYGQMTLAGEEGYFPRPYCNQMCELGVDGYGDLKLLRKNNVEMMNGSTDKSYYWLWGIREHNGAYYGVAYYILEHDPNNYSTINGGWPIFVTSDDGIHFTQKSEIKIAGNEASLNFIGDRAYIFFRPVETSDAIITFADSPYSRWTKNVQNYDVMMQSPDTYVLWDKIFVAMRSKPQDINGTRYYQIPIYAYDPATKEFKFVHEVIGASQDCAYTGMIVHDDALHLTYYSKPYSSPKPDIFYQKVPLNLLWDETVAAFK